MTSDAESLAEASKALESARELVYQLEDRVRTLSMGDYDELKAIADHLHSEGCAKDDGCSWAAEESEREYWFAPEHQAWVQRAITATQVSGVDAPTLRASMDLVHRAKRSAMRMR